MDSIGSPSSASPAAASPAHVSEKQPVGAAELIDEDDAVRKVEEATTPSKDAQEGVRNVEAVTLTWTKTSLALAFLW